MQFSSTYPSKEKQANLLVKRTFSQLGIVFLSSPIVQNSKAQILHYLPDAMNVMVSAYDPQSSSCFHEPSDFLQDSRDKLIIFAKTSKFVPNFINALYKRFHFPPNQALLW